jgi:hypothetical protein
VVGIKGRPVEKMYKMFPVRCFVPYRYCDYRKDTINDGCLLRSYLGEWVVSLQL